MQGPNLDPRADVIHPPAACAQPPWSRLPDCRAACCVHPCQWPLPRLPRSGFRRTTSWLTSTQAAHSHNR
eukprot:364815-Chlamydomonas_euryale.AAC.12